MIESVEPDDRDREMFEIDRAVQALLRDVPDPQPSPLRPPQPENPETPADPEEAERLQEVEKHMQANYRIDLPPDLAEEENQYDWLRFLGVIENALHPTEDIIAEVPEVDDHGLRQGIWVRVTTREAIDFVRAIEPATPAQQEARERLIVELARFFRRIAFTWVVGQQPFPILYLLFGASVTPPELRAAHVLFEYLTQYLNVECDGHFWQRFGGHDAYAWCWRDGTGIAPILQKYLRV